MSEIYHQYMGGEQIPSSQLPNIDQGLELYGEIIHFDWREDKATSQPDLFGEVWLTKVHPVVTRPREIHLQRPTPEEERAGKRIL